MSRNGHNNWNVVPSARYTEHLERAAPSQPRLREVLDGLEFELARAPFQEDRCTPQSDAPTNTRWFIESEPETPPFVSVSFGVKNRDVILEDFMILEEWEDQIFDDPRS